MHSAHGSVRLNYVSRRKWSEVAAGLKLINSEATADDTEECLDKFKVKWEYEYLPTRQSWL